MAATALVALAFVIPLGLIIQQLVQERALADAERQAFAIAAVLSVTTDPVAVDRALETVGDGAPAKIAVHNLSQPVGNQRARAEEIAYVATQASNGNAKPIVVSVAGGRAYLEPVDIGTLSYVVVEVYLPNSELHQGVNSAWLALSIVALSLVIASVIVSDRLASKVVRSARQLADASSSLGEGQLGVRVVPSGPRELAEAGESFNIMADHIATLLANERELVADLSHRLRTPVTALRLDAETLSDASGERIRDAIAALEAEIDQIIRVARKQQTVTIEPAEPPGCDVGKVVTERMTFWSAVATDQGRECRVIGADAAAPVTVPKSELAPALDALLGNVIRYTPQGVAFEVAVSRRKDGYIALRVEDAGPGIDDPERALRRGASDRGSTGLGLDIVRRVAEAGRGGVNIGRGRLGGASVVILLADAERPTSSANSNRFGLVGRLSREPGEQRRSGLFRR